MAKKKTIESFNNGCRFNEYLKLTNYKISRTSIYGNSNVDSTMKEIASKGYDFFKKYQEIHSKRSKPGFFSKLFNTKYNKLYKEETVQLDAMRGDLYKLGVPNKLLLESHAKNQYDAFEISVGVNNAYEGVTLNTGSIFCERWKNGINGYTDLAGNEFDFTPMPIEKYGVNNEKEAEANNNLLEDLSNDISKEKDVDLSEVTEINNSANVLETK